MEDNRKKENYVYPVTVEKDEDTYIISLLDFPDQVTCAYDEEEIIPLAQDMLALLIKTYLDENKPLPKPSVNAEKAIYVHVWMPYFKNRIKEVYARKNLTIPEWLDILAKENNVNFSAALVRGVKEELGLL